ncbi:MAG: HIT domain-containing protein [Pseudomonadales bacterium]
MSDDVHFILHARLAADCRELGDLRLSRLLLMDDSRFPWCILVPRRPGLSELHHLAAADRTALLDDIDAVSQALLTIPRVGKLNVGALGNVVAQLHVHVVGRHRDDAAWPGPVWGSGPAVPYTPDALAERTDALRQALGLVG